VIINLIIAFFCVVVRN